MTPIIPRMQYNNIWSLFTITKCHEPNLIGAQPSNPELVELLFHCIGGITEVNI